MLKIKDQDGNTIIVKEHEKSEVIVGSTTISGKPAFIYEKITYFKLNGEMHFIRRRFTKVKRTRTFKGKMCTDL